MCWLVFWSLLTLVLLELCLLLSLDISNGEHQSDTANHNITHQWDAKYSQSENITYSSLPNFLLRATSSFPTISSSYIISSLKSVLDNDRVSTRGRTVHTPWALNAFKNAGSLSGAASFSYCNSSPSFCDNATSAILPPKKIHKTSTSAIHSKMYQHKLFKIEKKGMTLTCTLTKPPSRNRECPCRRSDKSIVSECRENSTPWQRCSTSRKHSAWRSSQLTKSSNSRHDYFVFLRGEKSWRLGRGWWRRSVERSQQLRLALAEI